MKSYLKYVSRTKLTINFLIDCEFISNFGQNFEGAILEWGSFSVPPQDMSIFFMVKLVVLKG